VLIYKIGKLDPEHLLVSMESAEMVVIDVNKGMKNVIPYCKPTHPDVRMTLLHYGRDVVSSASFSSERPDPNKFFNSTRRDHVILISLISWNCRPGRTQ